MATTPSFQTITQTSLTNVLATWEKHVTTDPSHAYQVTSTYHNHVQQLALDTQTHPQAILHTHLQQWAIHPDWIQPNTYQQTLHTVMACQHHTITTEQPPATPTYHYTTPHEAGQVAPQNCLLSTTPHPPPHHPPPQHLNL